MSVSQLPDIDLGQRTPSGLEVDRNGHGIEAKMLSLPNLAIGQKLPNPKPV